MKTGAADILGIRDWLQVSRVYAVRRAAQMVECQSVGDGADKLGVRPPMGANGLSVEPEHAVTPYLRPIKEPAIFLTDFRPEAFGRLWRIVQRIAMTFLASVVHGAQALVPSVDGAVFDRADRSITPFGAAGTRTSKRIAVSKAARVMGGAQPSSGYPVGAINDRAHGSFYRSALSLGKVL